MLPKHIKIFGAKWLQKHKTTHLLMLLDEQKAEKVWKARDDALQAREDARNYLMKMVKEGRKNKL